MWDLDTMRIMNAPQVRKRQTARQPLELLAQKLKSSAPPSLHVLVAKLRDYEDFGVFVDLIRDFLPDCEKEILHEVTPSVQITTFASHFEDRYFPLDERQIPEISYRDFTMRIPVAVQGTTYDEYNEISSGYWRDGIPLVTYLIANPYYEADERVALAEACRECVAEELLALVPSQGLSPQEAHRLLDGTRFSAIAVWADYLNNNTGNFFLDTTDLELMESLAPDWNKEIVKTLTNAWQQSEKINQEFTRLFEWLEENPPVRFQELLKFIEERRKQNERGE